MTKTAAVGFEVRWRKNSDDANHWSSPVGVGADGHVSVPGLERVTDYTFEARAVSACGAKSAWATQTFNLPDVPAGTLTLADLKSEVDDAAGDAAAANAELAQIADDSLLSPPEKPTVERDYSVITTEQAGIDAQATAYGITTEKIAYDNAVSALTAYLATLTDPVAWNDKSGYTDIVGSTFRSKFAAVYTARQTLLNAIYAAAKQGLDSNQPLIRNPNFTTGDLTGWTVEPGVTGWGAQNAQATSPNPAIPTYVSYYAGSATNTALRNKACNPCQQGDVVTATCQVACQSGGGNGYVRIIFYNASSQELSGGGSGNQFSGNASGTSRATAIAPAGAVFFLVAPAVAGYTTGVFRFTAFTMSLGARSLDEVPDGSTRFGAVEPGADKTSGKPLSSLSGRTMDYIGDSATRFAAAESGADKTAGKSVDVLTDGVNYARNVVQSTSETVDNSGFELPLNADGSVPGWAASHASVALSTSAHYTGSQSLNLVPTASFGQVETTRKYSASPGDVYVLGAAIWSGSSTTAYAEIVAYNAAGASVGSGAVLSNNAAGWVAGKSAQYAMPAGTSYFTIVLTASAATVGVYFDAISLSRVRSLDTEVQDGTTYGRTANTDLYVSGGVNRVGLRVSGSGQTIGDQRNLLPVTWAGVRSVNSTSPITYTYTWNAGAGLYNISVNVAAYTLYGGAFSLNYAASSLSGTQAASTTVSAYYYYLDPTSSGGSLPLHFATDPAVLAQQNGVVFIGYATLTTPAAGGGTGGGTGGGGGGFCVSDDMFIGDGRRAGDAEIGDPFDCIDLPTAAGKHVRALQGVSRGVEECVRMITSDGCALVCSVSTPFDLPDGRATTALHMLGESVITDLGVATVISLALVGPRPVTRAHLGGVSYAAGADPHRRIYSHNAIGAPSKP